MRLRPSFPALRCLLSLVAVCSFAHAQEDEDGDGDDTRRQMTQQEIEQWLASEPDEPKDVGSVDEPEEAPPPPPPKTGFVAESSVGAMGHLGPLKNVSPVSPWFHLQFGYEPLKFLMVYAETDLVFSNTSYANPPPEPRSYALYGFGGGLRFTVKPTDYFGIYLTGSAGIARINEDVLFVYGYENADRWNLYFGGELGLEWYQINPHMALALHGGVRNYDAGLGRVNGQTSLAWISGVSLRYVF
jgi:hypothetical protein